MCGRVIIVSALSLRKSRERESLTTLLELKPLCAFVNSRHMYTHYLNQRPGITHNTVLELPIEVV